MSNLGIQALDLVTMGYYIFPIAAGTKQPVVTWSTESTLDPAEVRTWWERWPEDNIGINTGLSGLAVIDLDNELAMEHFMALWDRHEPDLPQLVVATRRGWHLYFDAPRAGVRNSAGRLGAGIDVRGSGGMVLAPGSVVAGTVYAVVSGSLRDVPPLPGWLERMLRPRQLSLSEERKRGMDRGVTNARQGMFRKNERAARIQFDRWCDKIVNAPDGEQNNTINSAAHVLARDYADVFDREEVRCRLEQAAMEGHHPLSRARPTIHSGLTSR